MNKYLLFSLILVTSILSGKEYTVVKGDCLWFIAERQYGDPFLWPIIYEANRDKIQNPHWIYPGQVFVIPPYQEKEIGVTPTALVPPPAETIAPTAMTESLPQETLQQYSTKKEEEFGEVTTVVGGKKFVFSKESVLLAGFITPKENLQTGKIAKGYTEYSRDLVLGNKVILNKGMSDGVMVKDKILFFRYGRGVHSYGTIVRILGIGLINEAHSNNAIAEIIASYEPIHEGDYFMPYKEIIPPEGKISPVLDNIEGKIIAFKNKATVVKPYDVVYITPGKGLVKPGDLFLIYRKGKIKNIGKDLPIFPVGKILIVGTREKTSSGYVVTIMGHMDIRRGDRVRLVGRVE